MTNVEQSFNQDLGARANQMVEEIAAHLREMHRHSPAEFKGISIMVLSSLTKKPIPEIAGLLAKL
jgi:hypothetical protein